MTILKYWREIAGALLVLAVIASYGYAHHKGYAEGVAATEAKVTAADAKTRANVASLNTELATEAAASVSQINALRAQIAAQPAAQKVVYVEVPKATPGPVEYVPLATPVFVSVGAVRDYNASLALGRYLEERRAVQSAVTVSDYEATTLGNNVSCLENTQQLKELIKWVSGVTNRRR